MKSVCVIRLLRGTGQRAQSLLRQRLLDARQREVRSKGTRLDLEAELLTARFDVVVQQLQPRLVGHAHPYDASPAKVRKRADAAERHEQLAVPRGNARDRGL